MALYPSKQVRQATRAEPTSITNWVRAKLVHGTVAQDETAHLRPFLFTFEQVMQIAIMDRLVRLGMRPSAASMVALEFIKGGDESRAPGHHYAEEDGETYLVSMAGFDRAAIVALKPTSTLIEIQNQLRDLMGSQYDREAAVVLLNVSEVEFLVRARLRIDRELRHMPPGNARMERNTGEIIGGAE